MLSEASEEGFQGRYKVGGVAAPKWGGNAGAPEGGYVERVYLHRQAMHGGEGHTGASTNAVEALPTATPNSHFVALILMGGNPILTPKHEGGSRLLWRVFEASAGYLVVRRRYGCSVNDRHQSEGRLIRKSCHPPCKRYPQQRMYLIPRHLGPSDDPRNLSPWRGQHPWPAWPWWEWLSRAPNAAIPK